MPKLRDITEWPPGVWVESGQPSLMKPGAVLTRARVHDKGITLDMDMNGREMSTTIPYATDRFKDIAVLLLASKGMTLEEIGELEVG